MPEIKTTPEPKYGFPDGCAFARYQNEPHFKEIMTCSIMAVSMLIQTELIADAKTPEEISHNKALIFLDDVLEKFCTKILPEINTEKKK